MDLIKWISSSTPGSLALHLLQQPWVEGKAGAKRYRHHITTGFTHYTEANLGLIGPNAKQEAGLDGGSASPVRAAIGLYMGHLVGSFPP